jgi:hypothetical protein
MAYRRPAMGTIPLPSPPNILVGGLDPDPPRFPLKACGNDGPRIGPIAACKIPGQIPSSPVWELPDFASFGAVPARARVKPTTTRLTRKFCTGSWGAPCG